MTRKFLLMKNVNLSVLISNFDIKLSKTKRFFRYSVLKIKFLHKKVSGDLGRLFGMCYDVMCLGRLTGDTCISKGTTVVTRVLVFHSCPAEKLNTLIIQMPRNLHSHTILAIN